MGPLAGFRIIEMAGIGPAPFAAMLLADMGAEVIRVDRREAADLGLPGREPKFDVLHRGRRSLALDVKAEAGRAVVKQLAAKADALIEGFRPGVMERLGLGPDELLALNPKLVFGRMTGFGQDGPLAQAAGHDINYIALAGVLHAIGRKGEAPVPPLNLVGDFGGGGMFLAFGVLCAPAGGAEVGQGPGGGRRHGRRRGLPDGGHLRPLLAGHAGPTSAASTSSIRGAPWYDVYETKDGKWLSVGAIEKRFYEELVEKLGLASAELPKQHDRKGWPELRERFAAAIAAQTRDEWERVFEGSDACVAPVLALGEVESHPHNVARATFVRARRRAAAGPGAALLPHRMRDGRRRARPRGADSEAVLKDWGFAAGRDRRAEEGGRGGSGIGGRCRPSGRTPCAHPLVMRSRVSDPEGLTPHRICHEHPSPRRSRRSARRSSRSARASATTTGWSATATAASRTSSTRRWPRPAGSASPCRRRTAARASASPRPRS